MGAIAFSLFAGSAAAGPISGLVVFGDSLSDTGNILALTSSPFAASLGYTPRPSYPLYTHGQFTNGPDNTGPGNPILNLAPTAFANGAWHNTLADRLGVPRAAAAGIESTPAGTNFAFGGAESGAGSLVSPGVLPQVERYTLDASLRPDALHIFWAGSNDLINAASAPGATPQQVLDAGAAAVANMTAAISQVAGAFTPGQSLRAMWANLPSLDQVPEGAALPTPLRGALAQASAAFRTAQAGAIAALEAQHPGLDIIALDIFALFTDLIANPAAAGFVNVTTPVADISDFGLPGPMTATQLAPAGANPDQWLFWDSLHPTARAHALIGEAAALAIPAPGAALAMVMIPLALAGRARRRT